MTYRKKLIEVSLPLEAINVASAREKSIRHGHPSTLHMWWSRKPLATCRAVLFSSLVDDPSEYMPDEESARIERERLFGIIEDLVLWENCNNEEVLDKAKMEIARSVARNLNVDVPVGKEAVREFLATKAPPVLDPFAGGGSIPLEAQRLGLRAYASDLNPVAVLINKALIEIPPKFANMPPVHPPEEPPSLKEGEGLGVRRKTKKSTPQDELWTKEWKGAQGLAEDVRYYGKWMRGEAFNRINHHYPLVTITKEILAERLDLQKQGLKVGDQLSVIAWLWARTVKCPNPACQAQMPLLSKMWLSTKKDSKSWLKPIVDNSSQPPKIGFTIKTGTGEPIEPPKLGRGVQFRCLACKQVAKEDAVREEFRQKRDGFQMVSIVAESKKGRVHLSPSNSQVACANNAIPNWMPDEKMNTETSNLVSGRDYGILYWRELFTQRQLVTITTFCDLTLEVWEKIYQDSKSNFENRAINPADYANAIVTYLAEAVSKFVTFHNMFAYWRVGENKSATGFGRQVLPMTWDVAEVNPFAGAGGDFLDIVTVAYPKVISSLPAFPQGNAQQLDARNSTSQNGMLISTDPPYYDNIGYADLSDFFYVWLRRLVTKTFPDLFATILVPKTSELVALSYRFGGDKDKAESYFENGFREVFAHTHDLANHNFPITIYYAFKQTEEERVDDNDDSDGYISVRASTGWETILEAVLGSGLQITGTWPMRTEQTSALKTTVGGLASSIVLVCRPRPNSAVSASRREFLSALKKELAHALRELQQGSIAPVDLAQASIGPGMAIYSRYSAVLEADGKPMSVRTALTLINQALDEFLAEQEGEYDGDTRWALTWFEQYGHNEAAYGEAETLSRAKNTSVDGLSEAGIVEARGGKVRLYKREELDTDWDPTQDKRLTAWESAAHLIYALENGGEESAAELLAKLSSVAEVARDLAYRLYTVCERKGWSQDALGYNMLVVAWPRLKELAAKQKSIQENLL